MKTYSVIIPHKDNVNGLERLLKSVYLNDKDIEYGEFLSNLKVIVVDDHSKDECFERLISLQKEYGFYLYKNHKKANSAGICRNIGLANAESDYVLFLDSDDFLTPCYYKILLEYDNNASDIIFFSPISVMDSDINKLSNRHIFYSNLVKEYQRDKTSEKYLRYTWLGPWSKRFRLDYIKKYDIKFDETIASNDVMFSVVAGHKADKIDAVDVNIYCLTRRQGSLIYHYSYEILTARVGVGIRYKEYCDSVGFTDYKDHCINHLMRGMILGVRPFCKLLRFAKNQGVFNDKVYAFKHILTGIAGNFIVLGKSNLRNLLKIDKK